MLLSRVLSVLLLQHLTLVLARVYNSTIALGDEYSPLKIRDERVSCGAQCRACNDESDCGTALKRSVYNYTPDWFLESDTGENGAAIVQEASGNHSSAIQKRDLKKLRGPTAAAYCAALCKKGSKKNLCPFRSKRQVSFAVQQTFTDQKYFTLNTASTVLSGCSILTVVSNRAVYMTHLFQDLGFENAPPTDEEALKKWDPTPPDFQKNVLNLIEGLKPLYRADGPALDASLFNQPGDNSYASIMTPRDPENMQDYYPDKVGILKVLLEKLIPGIRFDSVPYISMNEEYDPGYGAAAFEYDPDGDGVGNADWRLLYENNMKMGSEINGLVGSGKVNP